MRLFAAWALAAVLAGAMPEGYWAAQEPFALKKDQFAVWNNGGKTLTFRWTLFHNRALVTLTKYDRFPYQHLLYREYRKDGMKIPLTEEKAADRMAPYVYIRFKDFDEEKQEGSFILYLYDPKGSVKLMREEGEQ